MRKEKQFNYSNDIVQFGFLYNDKKKSKITLKSIIDSVEQSIVVYDYKNILLSNITSEASDLLNDNNKLFIALTSDNELRKLMDSGVKTGFIRSTNKSAHGAIIIVDKEKMYFASSKDIIFESYKNAIPEVFNYINYLIWNTASYEILQGQMNDVKGIRHSIVKPVFEKLISKEVVAQKDIIGATEDIEQGLGLNYIHKEEHVINSLVIDSSVSSIARTSRFAFIKAFEEVYLQVKYDSCIELAESFKSLTYQDLVGKSAWIDGKKTTIEENLKITKTLELPLDSYKDFEPDFEKYINNNQLGKNMTIDVILDIQPMKIDSSYKVSNRYKRRQEIIDSIDTNVDKLIKLFEDDEKLLNQIKTESRIVEKAKKYNVFIENNEAGLKVLKTKKNKDVFKKVIVNENDIAVPNEIIGKLYEKNNSLYFAVEDEKHIKKAKEFLKEHNLEAVMVSL